MRRCLEKQLTTWVSKSKWLSHQSSGLLSEVLRLLPAFHMRKCNSLNSNLRDLYPSFYLFYLWCSWLGSSSCLYLYYSTVISSSCRQHAGGRANCPRKVVRQVHPSHVDQTVLRSNSEAKQLFAYRSRRQKISPNRRGYLTFRYSFISCLRSVIS